ncbi:hypothetical protein HYALB_00013769 [Hymenoscyphus albidus]|uniref:Uncharacterized protein n=1 Tax=Hymenoscyphus albidus TaxID=595503 RepID=A0A9N9M299_9HELO|nr:hypothetical protein HYALB_00013769 [Hymenoscyphus albidus]
MNITCRSAQSFVTSFIDPSFRDCKPYSAINFSAAISAMTYAVDCSEMYCETKRTLYIGEGHLGTNGQTLKSIALQLCNPNMRKDESTQAESIGVPIRAV